MTRAELAQRWGVTERTLARWKRLGRALPPEARHLGKRPVRYLISDVEAFEASIR
jgi:predicted site-specific integrase-resolvase